MKTKLSYEFKDEDNSDFYIIANASNFYYVSYDLDQWLRSIVKYNADELSSEQIDMAEKIRDKLHELLEEHGVDFEHVS